VYTEKRLLRRLGSLSSSRLRRVGEERDKKKKKKKIRKEKEKKKIEKEERSFMQSHAIPPG
jgi:hypothetical protein